jgi:hypothetical protein
VRVAIEAGFRRAKCLKCKAARQLIKMSCRTGPSMRFVVFWPKKQQQRSNEQGTARVGPVRYSLVRRQGEGDGRVPVLCVFTIATEKNCQNAQTIPDKVVSGVNWPGNSHRGLCLV